MSIGRETEFPLVEAFGFAHDAEGPAALTAWSDKSCPFAGGSCEKYRQYRFGYCSVSYAAETDGGVRKTYAVCDHRLDGAPLQMAIADHFANPASVKMAKEVVLKSPRTSFDYVFFELEKGAICNPVAVETQSIDLRGGGVGPAWRAWEAGEPEKWRAHFSVEAKKKGRRDTVDYGVNMANVFKRLGVQVAEKGEYLKKIGVPLYIVMQDPPFQYLRSRVKFQPVASNKDWDITFLTFDYTGRKLRNGQLEFANIQTVRTTVASYSAALAAGSRSSTHDLAHFLERVKRKAGLPKTRATLKRIL